MYLLRQFLKFHNHLLQYGLSYRRAQQRRWKTILILSCAKSKDNLKHEALHLGCKLQLIQPGFHRLKMASSSSSGLTFKLHPLVIVNISDHHTRVKSQSNPHKSSAAAADGGVTFQPPRVYGCVIGVQRGRTVEIFNSFELLYDPSTHSLDRAFLEKKQELCWV